MSGLGEAFAKVTSEKAQEPIGAEFNAALNGGDYELRHSEPGSRPVADLVGEHRSDMSVRMQKPIGAEFNAALNGGDYELRHSESGPTHSEPGLKHDCFSTACKVSPRVGITSKIYGERSASLQAQTDALCNDVSEDTQSGIEIEDL